jgi:RNA polymerase sigma factor (sigma-70 family)
MYDSPDNGPAAGVGTHRLLEEVQAYLACPAGSQTPGRPLIEAWQQFFRIYDPIIRRFIIACHVPTDDLSDCQQEVWTALIVRLRDFHYAPTRGKFTSWLYTLVRSKAVDLTRRRTRHPIVDLGYTVALLSDHTSDPGMAYERRCQQQMVQSMLTELKQAVSPRNYHVLHMRWIEERTVLEVAAALHLTPQQVRLTEHRMRSKFRNLYVARV